jgi:hypothetical protein
MKTPLLMLSAFFAFLFFSCSTDDENNNPQSRVTATINGVPIIFDYVTVERVFYAGYTDLKIVATTAENPSNWIEFKLTENATGNNITYFFAYYLNLVWYEQQSDLVIVVTENSEKLLSGSFSGTVEHYSGEISDAVLLTDGTFMLYR